MIHVCFGVYDKDGRYSKFAGTTIASIFDNTTSEVTVHILHDNTMTLANYEKFIYLAGKYGQQIKFYNVEKLCADKIAELRKAMPSVEKDVVSIGTLYRLLMIHVLSNITKKIIYLDSDIIVNSDIKDFWQIDIKDKPLAAVTEISNGMVPKLGLPMCHDGFVKDDDYFNAGVLLVNLDYLSRESELIGKGIHFQSQHPNYIHFDQDILNWCFSTKYLKVPTKFNCFVRNERRNRRGVESKIYHYLGSSYGQGITPHMQDPFNRLWFKYFEKTPWFNAESIGHIYDGVRQIQHELQSRAIFMSKVMAGRQRAFFVPPNNLEPMKKVFGVDANEEVILAIGAESFKQLVDSMKKSNGSKLYFIITAQFPGVQAALTRAGFKDGKDFLNGLMFLSEAHGVPMNSYSLIKAL